MASSIEDASSRNDDNYNIPIFYISQHDSTRDQPLDELAYGSLLNLGFTFVTAPISNRKFYNRVLELTRTHLAALEQQKASVNTTHTPNFPDPVVPPLTAEDTGLYPSPTSKSFTAYCSPWIDICSPSPVISSVSRQVLNQEVNYANFCGVRTVIIPGPRQDATTPEGSDGLARYARAVKEVLGAAPRLSFVIHVPMYREPGLEEPVDSLTTVLSSSLTVGSRELMKPESIDLFSAWDSWDFVRTICEYNLRLFVGVRFPKKLAERELQTRWFSEPVHLISIHKDVFQLNQKKCPCLSKAHQDLIREFHTLKNTPWIMLCDVGPDGTGLAAATTQVPDSAAFPSLSDAHSQQVAKLGGQNRTASDYIQYLRWIEATQDSLSDLEYNTLSGFQDWLQSPLQPLSDNLESTTYEVFEGDPVKYNQYEAATIEALRWWKKTSRKTSSGSGAVVVAVVGSGRGPLVHRALKASQVTGVPVEVWAIEKNPNAYVYLLQRNAIEWGGRVHVVRTDMRSWKGPLLGTSDESSTKYGQVDILISELLGSFADNELSPECLDGVQHVLAPEGISIPSSYTAHLSPIATPRIHADLVSRAATDKTTFDTPWVVRLFQLDFAAARGVPGHPLFQEMWEFSHPLPKATWDQMTARGQSGLIGGVGGSMEGSVGANEHNARFSRVKFVCLNRGVIHGLAGYFESTLFECQDSAGEVKVEISTHPERIDQKSKDMISWFPIFFPLKRPLHYPDDSELEISMWRQTDDKSVWYEWLVEAYCWAGEKKRLKLATSDLCSSRSVACKML